MVRVKLNWIQDWENREFHITPVLTYTWYHSKDKDMKSAGWGIALEWGVWAVVLMILWRKN